MFLLAEKTEKVKGRRKLTVGQKLPIEHIQIQQGLDSLSEQQPIEHGSTKGCLQNCICSLTIPVNKLHKIVIKSQQVNPL